MGIASVLALLMSIGGQEGTPIPAPPSPVSVERVREGLQRPTLKIPPLEPAIPVFRGSVEVDLPLDTPLQAMRRELAADSGYSGRGPDIIGAVMGIVKRIKAARRAHAEAEIRKEVQAELNVFCAEHDCSVLEDGPPPIEGVIIPRKRPAQ